MQAEPFARSLVPDFDAEAARHVLGGNPDRLVAAARSKMIVRAIELVADSGKIAVLDNRDAADPGRGRRRMDRIAVELDRQEPRQGPQEAVELQGTAVAVEDHHAETLGIAQFQSAVLPIAGGWNGQEIAAIARDRRANLVGHARKAGQSQFGEQFRGGGKAREIIDLEIDHQSEPAQQLGLIAEIIHLVVEIRRRPVVALADGASRTFGRIFDRGFRPLIEAPCLMQRDDHVRERLAAPLREAGATKIGQSSCRAGP